jgi:histone acetyltransferase (RNA polymerase elongator complex component)
MLPLQGDGEVAFYGGSFTMLEENLQQEYLACVMPYLRTGRIGGIRVSTRPDACGSEVVARLKRQGVSTVELGCQSFSDRVLGLSQRGHGPEAAEGAVTQLRNAGMRIGLQLMPGLPGGSFDEARYSLDRALQLRPGFVRIYPTVVLKDTALERAWLKGDYAPLDLEQAVELCAELLWHCHQSGVPVIRLGLQSTESLDSGAVIVDGPYHPAFGQLVRSRLWRRAIENAVAKTAERRVCVAFADLGDVLGHRRANFDYFKRRFSSLEIVADDHVARGSFVLDGHCCDMMSKARYLQPLSKSCRLPE